VSTWYCDLSGDYTDVTGAVDAKQAGPGGLHALLRGAGTAGPVVAGDKVLLKGTGLFSRLVQVALGGNPDWEPGL